MPLPSGLRNPLLKPVCVAVFLITALLYILPRHDIPPSTSALQAFTPSVSHYNDGYRHNSSHEPADPPPSFNFTDLSKVNRDSLSYAHYDPFVDSKSLWHASRKPCVGPRGVDINGNPDDMLLAYAVKSPVSIPEPVFGSYHEGGLDREHCFDRNGRLGLYGYSGVNTMEMAPPSRVNWTGVDWGTLQDQCVEGNADRYALTATPMRRQLRNATAKDLDFNSAEKESKKTNGLFRKPKPRTAVVVRAHHKMNFGADTMMHLRSLIAELSLHSGGEYSIFLLVQVKGEQRSIDEPEVYQDILEKQIPHELRNMTILFKTESLAASWYANSTLKVESLNMALLVFAELHPEFDHFWQTELDVRYTGHWYNLLENADSWARSQPRKLQWERASRFFVPYIHKTWANFINLVQASTPDGGVWGSPKHIAVPEPMGPEPPVTDPAKDKYAWGVGEDADIVAVGATVYWPGDKDWGIGKEFPNDPQRTLEVRACVQLAIARFSRRLLRVMHATQSQDGVAMTPEIGPFTYAKLHGFKIAHFPLPNYYDPKGDMPTDVAAVEHLINQQGPESPFKNPRPGYFDNFMHRFTYWLNYGGGQVPQELYKRWMGDVDIPTNGPTLERLCMPGMLLHPVKDQ